VALVEVKNYVPTHVKTQLIFILTMMVSVLKRKSLLMDLAIAIVGVHTIQQC